MANANDYEQMYKKYVKMAQTKAPWQKTINMITPTMGDMLGEDLAYEAFIQKNGKVDSQDDATKTAFYTEKPSITQLGYDTDLDALFVKVKISKNEYNGIDTSWLWNYYDGDTLHFDSDSVDIGSNPITTTNAKYNTFQEYYAASTNQESLKSKQQIGLRFVGMNTGELPHYSNHYVKKNQLQQRIVAKRLKEVKNNSNYNYLKYPVNGKDSGDYTIKNRSDNELVFFLKVGKSNMYDNNSNTYSYHEIIPTTDKLKVNYQKIVPTEEQEKEIRKDIPGYISKRALPLPTGDIYNDTDDIAFLVVTKDESELVSVVDAYKAQNILKEKIVDNDEVYFMLDAGTLTLSNKIEKSNIYVTNLFYTFEFCSKMINDLKANYSDIRLSGYNYSLYGSDIYGRFLGCVYTKTKDGSWINLNKLILIETPTTVQQPDYSSSPEMDGKKLSDAFEIWTYDRDRIKWLDSFEQLTQDSYNDRISLHEKLSGLKFCNFRDNSVLLGDTLFIIPPTNIRSVTQTSYEKTPLLRSKGQLTRGGNHNESLLELKLFFAGDHGINGIPYKHTFPSGETCTYYMNGLRSLIAQFKLTPFLPIENTYINDVLNIEAVSLMNIDINTVPEYPQMVQVTLVLRQFNYRMYMPDLPVGMEQDIDKPSLAEMNPIFAKTIQWEVFRYYYQRLLLSGETLKKLTYNTADYNEYLYRSLTPLQPTNLCNSNISFYIPDIDWLDDALDRKKSEDTTGLMFDPAELNDETKAIIPLIANTYENVEKAASELNNKLQSLLADMNVDLLEYNSLSVGYQAMNKKYLNGKSHIKYIENKNGVLVGHNLIEELYMPLHDIVEKHLLKTGIFNSVVGEEVVVKNIDSQSDDKKYSVTWFIRSHIKALDNITDLELSKLKDFIINNLGYTEDDKIPKTEILKDNTLSLMIQFVFDEDKKLVSYPATETDTMLKIIKQFEAITNGDITNSDQNAMDKEDFDWRDPSKMVFVPYIENAIATEMSMSLTNNFTETKLKSVDGVAGQYVGGQDTIINLKIVTCNELLVTQINSLPAISFQYTNQYRRILASTPVRIHSEFTELAGINEVNIEMVDINTIDEFPGAYEINVRMSSVDRSIRKRETLRKMEFTANGGFVGKGHGGKQSIKSYFDLDAILSTVEVYPDLELPTLEDLKARGYGFIRYTLSNSNRVYPDPDFYVVYSYGYTAAILKQQTEQYFKQLLAEDAVDEEGNPIPNPLHDIVLSDEDYGTKLVSKLDDSVGLHLISQNQNADIIDEELSKIIANVEKEAKTEKDNSKLNKSFIHHKEAENGLKYLLMSNATEGWTIKPSWTAPLCDPETNDMIANMPKKDSEQSLQDELSNNQAAIKLKTTRRDVINLIDKILSEPIKIPNDISNFPNKLDKVSQEQAIDASIQFAIDDIFVNNKNGESLINKLYPLRSLVKKTSNEYSKGFDKPYILNFIKSFTYAAACIKSSSKEYDKELIPGLIKDAEGLIGIHPNIHTDGWGPTMWFNEGKSFNTKNIFIPLCKTDGVNIALQDEVEINGTVSKKLEDRYNAMIDYGIEFGNVFGPFAIRTYSSDQLSTLTQPQLNYKYVDNYYLYDNNIPNDGFLDPYYNKLDVDSEELKQYKKAIMINSHISAVAFLRNVLVWIRKLIFDGLFISDIDILADDIKSVFGLKGLPDIDLDKDSTKDIIKESKKHGMLKIEQRRYNSLIEEAKDLDKENDNKTTYEEDNSLDDLFLMYAALADGLPKSFCMRMIYPILMAATDGSTILYQEMLDRNYNGLDSIVSSSIGSGYIDKMHQDLKVFFKALNGLGVIELPDLEKGWTDLSQRMHNTYSQEMYTSFANNPKIFAMHSFYDMLMNDKRGRLVRAFPTYYMLIIDEGRKIGYYKLHDNFYNMSSIAEIQVVKSRKNPTDTAMVTMTNTYNSYASEHDNTTKFQYADLYGVKDAIDSIFSPSRYYEKVSDIRDSIQEKDKVVLKAGARIHIRMGYSADASKMPTMFNGRIAEVNVGEVVDLVAQGDGIELVNPLNALGNIEANGIKTAQSILFPSVLTNLRGSLARGGWSPRNLLATILSAEYGGKEKILNDISNGRWFNTNPFGITHFGDKEYTEFFEQGEVVQNLFEVSDDNWQPDISGLKKSKVKKKSTPIINTSLYDKTFWDLMHISARAGLDYNCAIRDFGFRSTIFLGQNNHYYAYGYKQQNNTVYEMRKPFQQYHYIDYECDLIYNTIKASERDIKTNAVGLWQATKKTFGRKSATTSPMYLDINIYPEYQKSMTYDTGLLADGNGVTEGCLGILDDIPFFTSMAESHWLSGSKHSDDQVNDDKVNVELAERMTINALKETVKDMYSGEVAIIGNPAIKPFDSVQLRDTQEDMMGTFEVETVIHTLNAYTGFTTTIHPDLIVRNKGNAMQMATQNILGQWCANIIPTFTVYSVLTFMSKLESPLLRAIGRMQPAMMLTDGGKKAVDKILESGLVTKNIDMLDKEVIRTLEDKLSKVGLSVSGKLSSSYLTNAAKIIDELADININANSSIETILKYINKLEDLKLDSIDEHLENVIEKAKTKDMDVEKYLKLQDELKEINEDLLKVFNSAEDGVDLSKFFNHLEATKSDVFNKLDKEAIKALQKTNYKLTDTKDLNKLNKILKNKELNKILTDASEEVLQDSFKDGVKTLVKFGDTATDVVDAKGLAKLVKWAKSIDFKDITQLVIAGPPGFFAQAVRLIVQALATVAFGQATRAFFMSWFDSLQTLTIYPMKQYGKNFTAGISGAKACYSEPSSDGWNSIQGMIMQAYDKLESGGFMVKFFIKPFIDDFLVDEKKFKDLSDQYKQNLGITEKELTTEDVVRNLYDEVSKGFDMRRQANAAQSNRVRIQSFDGYNKDEKDNPITTSYNKYALRNIKVENIATNPDIGKLVAIGGYPSIQSYIKDGRLIVAHDVSNEAQQTNIMFENKSTPINMLPGNPDSNITENDNDNTTWDLPALREDSLVVLKTILDENYKITDLKNNIFEFHSGTLINSSTWRSTGYVFYIKPSLGAKTSSAFKKASDLLNGGTYKMFTYGQHPSNKDFYCVKIFPPAN